MTLNPLQIQCLYTYCSTIGISEYDVQTELVDHFTEWIENRWSQTPDKRFSDILNEMKEAFPEKELRVIASEKRKAVERELWNIYKKEFISFFNIPKISLSLLLILIFLLYPWPDDMSAITFINRPILLSNMYMISYSLFTGKNIIKRNSDNLIYPLLIHQKLSQLQWKAVGGFVAIFLTFLTLSLFTDITFKNEITNITLKITMPLYIISAISITHTLVRVNFVIRNRYPLAFK